MTSTQPIEAHTPAPETPDNTSPRLSTFSFREQLESQRQISQSRPTDAEHVQNQDLPPLTIEDTTLTDDQKRVASIYQNQFLDPKLLANITPLTPKTAEQSDEAYRIQREEELKKTQEQIQSELHNGVWGPASQAAFTNYLNWIQQTFPQVVRELAANNIALPADAPVSPADQGLPVDQQQFATEIITGQRTLNLGISTDSPPTESQQRTIDDALIWISNGARLAMEARNERTDQEIMRVIKEEGLPESWLPKPGQDREAWRLAVLPLLDSARRVARLLAVADQLHLPIEKPVNAKVTTTEDGRYVVSLDLPADTRLSDPRTAQILQELIKWQTKTEEIIKETINKERNPSPFSAIAWGETSIPDVRDPNNPRREVNAQVRLDKDGNLIGQFNPFTDKLEPGQTAVDANHFEQRPTARVDSQTGEIVVQQRVQAQNVPWYGYMNSFSTNVGKPFVGPEVRYKPDDLVAVDTGSRIEYMKAKDLPSHVGWTRLTHEVANITTVSMDAGFAGIGLPEVSAGIRAARLAGSLAGVPGRAILKGSIDTVLASTGVLNNSYWQQTELGRRLALGRNTAFVIGAARSSLSFIANMRPFRAITAGAGRSAQEVQQLVEASGSVTRGTHQVGEAVVNYAGFAMAPEIAHTFAEQVRQMGWLNFLGMKPDDPNDTTRGRLLFEGRRESETRNPNEGTVHGAPRTESAEETTRNIQRYRDLLTANLPETREGRARKEQIAKIFEKLQQVMSASPEDQERFRQELAKNITFTSSEVIQMERHLYGRFTDQQLRDLTDPEKRRDTANEHVRRLASQFMSNRDPLLKTASELALLYLSSKTGTTDGANLTLTIGAHSVLRVPVSGPNVPREERGQAHVVVPQRDITIRLDQELLIDDLRRSLNTPRSDSASIATTQLLTAIGASNPHQYAAVLQNVLSNPSSTRSDRLKALIDAGGGPTIITAAMAIRAEESRIGSLDPQQRLDLLASTSGTTYRDIQRTLTDTASRDSDPNVRAMAAGMLFGLKLMETSPTEGMAFVLKTTELYKQSGAHSDFATRETALLMEQLKPLTANSVGDKIAAAQSLNLLIASKTGVEADQQRLEIARSLAESFKTASVGDTIKLIEALGKDGIKLLATTDPELASAVQRKALAYINTPNYYRESSERNMIELIKAMPDFLNNQELKQEFFKKAEDILNNSLPTNSALRSAVIGTISAMGMVEARPILQRVAAVDSSASVRQAAIEALVSLRDPDLLARSNNSDQPDLLARLIENEKDPTVLSLLKDLKFGLEGSVSSSTQREQVQAFRRTLEQRYPDLVNEFDLNAQKKVIDETVYLLNPDRFKQELLEKTKPYIHDPEKVKEITNQAVIEREAQFKLLVETARGADHPSDTPEQRRINNVIAAKAREILLSISKGDIQIAPPEKTIILGQTIETYGSEQGSSAISVVDVTFKDERTDWHKAAAKVIENLAAPGSNWRDVTAGLVFRALEAGVQGEARESLLRAWNLLGTANGGIRPIPLEVQQYSAGRHSLPT